jgi:hypothetical protein
MKNYFYLLFLILNSCGPISSLSFLKLYQDFDSPMPEKEQDLETPPTRNPRCPNLRYLPEHLVLQQTPRLLWWAPHVRIFGEENTRNENAVEYAFVEHDPFRVRQRSRLAINVDATHEIYLGSAEASLKPAPFRTYNISDCEDNVIYRLEEDLWENAFQYDFMQPASRKSGDPHGGHGLNHRYYTKWKIMSVRGDEKEEVAKIEIRDGIEGFEGYISDDTGFIASFVRFNRKPPWFGCRWAYEFKRKNALLPEALLLIPTMLDRCES